MINLIDFSMFNSIFQTKVNIIVRILVLSDFFLFFSNGLFAPIYGVFILEKVPGASLSIIGFAAAVFWVSRVASVIPLSKLMDRIKGERDEYHLMILGTFMIAILPMFYMFVSAPWHVFLIQVFNGLAFSMVIPAWRVIFTSHIDQGRVCFEWSLDDVGVGIATAISAAVGGVIAQHFGFSALFIFIFLVGLSSTMVLLLLYHGDGSFAEWFKQRRQARSKKGL